LRASARVLPLQRSEGMQGRKKIRAWRESACHAPLREPIFSVADFGFMREQD
jgi:hypothetical protein